MYGTRIEPAAYTSSSFEKKKKIQIQEEKAGVRKEKKVFFCFFIISISFVLKESETCIYI